MTIKGASEFTPTRSSPAGQALRATPAGARRLLHFQEALMLHNVKICAAVFVFAAFAVGQVQAAGKGPSHFTPGFLPPGHSTVPSNDHGKSGNSPGDLKNDVTTTPEPPNAKQFAPGQHNTKK
jgi:hypothetical protein